MTDHNLMPKHGEQVTLSEANAERLIKHHICKLQQHASINLSDMLGAILINDKTRLVILPCKQCVLDISLQFHDLAEALKELVDGK